MRKVVAIMRNFSIEKTDIGDYGYLVIATSYDSPTHNLSEIEKEIGDYTGKIIFDLTIINGLNSNRYLEAEVVNGKIIRRSFKSTKNVMDSMKEISEKFFINNSDIIEQGTISNALKFLLKTGQRL